MRARLVVIAVLTLAYGSASTPRAGAPSPCARASEAPPRKAMHVVYLKGEHTLCLLREASVVWSTSASHGRNPGKKRFEGDGRTPEGAYTLSPARKSAKFGTFLAISYPGVEDVRFARLHGRQPGSAVGIHGPQSWYAFLGSWQAALDHSDGCIVLDRRAIEQLAPQVTRPLPLDILP